MVHRDYGVYLGSGMGMGFWSKADPVGQDSAVTFPSREAALEYVTTWDSQDGFDASTLTFLPVVPDVDRHWASIAACVAVGAPTWDPNE